MRYSFHLCLLPFIDGKSKLSESPAAFNKAASEQYRKLSYDEKESLIEKVKNESLKEMKMTKHEVIKSGRKIFKKIQSCVSTFVQFWCLSINETHSCMWACVG